MSDMSVSRFISGKRKQTTRAAKETQRRRVNRNVEVRKVPDAAMRYALARAEEIGGSVKVAPDGTVVILNG